ncbi:MAG: LysM domain-containing protein, partial [Polyangiales bacterium]
AELYYGDPRRESALVNENGLEGAGGSSSIVVGLRLTIPLVRYHRVQAGETWAELAERYYGDVRRAFVLAEANTVSGKTPAPGAQLLIPHPLRYTAGAHDPLRQAARDFFDGSTKTIAMLRRFNNLKGPRVNRGDVLLLPISNLVLSDAGKKAAQEQGQSLASAAQARSKQLAAQEELAGLRQHVQEGRFVEAVALANQLLGAGQLTGNQLVTIQRELGTALVALDREDLAFEAFKALVEQQPDIELGLSDTSPRVLRVLDRARRASETRSRSVRDQRETPKRAAVAK